MNGRCDNDALDTADDVCDLCGGEFCSACLVAATKRNKTIACKSCTMINAAVRPGKITRVRSKRDAKKRRQEIKEERTPMHEEGRFVFFDESMDETLLEPDDGAAPSPDRVAVAEAIQPGSLDTRAATGSRNNAQTTDEESHDDWLSQLDLKVEKKVDTTRYSPEESYAVPTAPAMERLEQLRAASDAPSPGLPPAKPMGQSTPIIEPLADTDRPHSFDEIDPFATAAAPAAATEPETDASVTHPPTPAAPHAGEPSPAVPPEALRVPPPDPAPVEIPAAFLKAETARSNPNEASSTRPTAMPLGFAPGSVQASPPQHRRTDDAQQSVVAPEPAPDEIDKNGVWVPPALRGV